MLRSSLGSGKYQAARAPVLGKARVLLVLERRLLVELIALTLNHGAYITRAVTSTSEVEASVAEWQPHLVILDMDLDGTQILSLLSHRQSVSGRLPVIGLTRRGDLKTKLAAFEAGADDMLTVLVFDAGVDDMLAVPFAPEELLARVIALLRRSYGGTVSFTPVITVGELKMDILNGTVRAGTSELRLTAIEESLLYLLAANAGRVVTREEILDTLWGVDYVAESNVVDSQIRNLRAGLQDDWREPRFIATVPRRGYRFLASADIDVMRQYGDMYVAAIVGARSPRVMCARH